MIPAFEEKNYQKMKELAHSLKGASAYIGASRIHYCCYYIQEHFVYERYDKMLEYYPSLVEASIEFQKYSR
jgi:HPt (histidine-containing phosphotransfer) domain-containing protein